MLSFAGLTLFPSCGKNDVFVNLPPNLASPELIQPATASMLSEAIEGSWHDNSHAALHFSLFKDGTARSDNMETLVYKNWRVDGQNIIFTIESRGNQISSIDEIVYQVYQIENDKLVLMRNGMTFSYTKI